MFVGELAFGAELFVQWRSGEGKQVIERGDEEAEINCGFGSTHGIFGGLGIVAENEGAVQADAMLVKAANVGEILAPGTTVLTIGDIDHPWLRGYINETDLGRVKLGTKARVTTDSYPGKVYSGRVSFIASEAEFTPKQIQTSEERVKLVYRIKIDVDNPQHELKSNMPADAEMVLQ